jgi:AraC-like DNA-binding protein
MNGDPAHPWTLGELAKAAAMSRTSFAVRFKSVIGSVPGRYRKTFGISRRMELQPACLPDHMEVCVLIINYLSSMD